MSFVFVDRESSYPNRYLVTPETGSPYYIVLTRADEPVVTGTPLNADTFNAMLASFALPEVTTDDNDKFLRVVNGSWVAAVVPIAEGDSV